MRVLISAIACSPDHGSESAVGWKSAMAIARFHDVHVITHSDNRNAIERFVKQHHITNPTFTYFGSGGPYSSDRLLARCQSWMRYFAWTRESLTQARALMGDRRFDVVHHVTYSTYRVGSPLWKLGIPFVFGPVGGGEKLPWVTAPSMSYGQILQEVIRSMADFSTRLPGSARKTIRRSTALIASNKVTAGTLRDLAGKHVEIGILPVVFFNEDHILDIRSKAKNDSRDPKQLTIFSSGMLEGRKGLSIALHAVRSAVERGLKIDFTIPSRGPEFKHLRLLTQKLGLSGCVHFPESLSRGSYWGKLVDSDIYMAPSLRDNCPATLLEAMLSRCVPIVANCNGPGEVVSHNVGEVVSVGTPEQMASEIADKLVKLAVHKNYLKAKGDAASDYVAATFTEHRYSQFISNTYHQALSDFKVAV